MCQVHTGAYVSLIAPGKTGYNNTACQRRKLPRIYCMEYPALRIRTADQSHLEKETTNEKKIKERKEDTTKRKNEKGKERKGKRRQEEEARKGQVE